MLIECLLCTRPNSGSMAVNKRDTVPALLGQYCGERKRDSRQEHLTEGKQAKQEDVIAVGAVYFGSGGQESPVEVGAL